jgi:hypothetical protein
MKKIKMPFDASFNFFSFQMYFDHFTMFFFFTFGQILNCLSTNMIITKKIIIKIPKCLLMLILIFFSFNVF